MNQAALCVAVFPDAPQKGSRFNGWGPGVQDVTTNRSSSFFSLVLKRSRSVRECCDLAASAPWLPSYSRFWLLVFSSGVKNVMCFKDRAPGGCHPRVVFVACQKCFCQKDGAPGGRHLGRLSLLDVAFGPSCLRRVSKLSTGRDGVPYHPGNCGRCWTFVFRVETGMESGMQIGQYSGRWNGEWRARGNLVKVECRTE